MKNSIEHLLWLFTVIFVCCFLKITFNITWHVFFLLFNATELPSSFKNSSLHFLHEIFSGLNLLFLHGAYAKFMHARLLHLSKLYVGLELKRSVICQFINTDFYLADTYSFFFFSVAELSIEEEKSAAQQQDFTVTVLSSGHG